MCAPLKSSKLAGTGVGFCNLTMGGEVRLAALFLGHKHRAPQPRAGSSTACNDGVSVQRVPTTTEHSV